MIKYRAEVAAIKESVWSTNSMTYDTAEEAKAWLDDLKLRWFGYDMSRVVTTDTPRGEMILESHEKYQNFRRI